MTDDSLISEEQRDQPSWPEIPIPFDSRATRWPLTACIGWVQARKDIYPYAEGFRRAAEAVFESCRTPDLMVWPLVFLWRHYVELMLKDIISKGREIADEEAGFPAHHRLLDLWKEARSRITHWWSADMPGLENVDVVIEQFHRVDPNATGFRYPYGKNQARSLPNAPDEVNLGAFHESMEKLADFLEVHICGMNAELECRSEWYGHY